MQVLIPDLVAELFHMEVVFDAFQVRYWDYYVNANESDSVITEMLQGVAFYRD